MKVAISSHGKTLEDLLDTRFGRCSYIQVIDTDTQSIKVIDNQGILAQHGAGIKAATQVMKESIEAVITGNLGSNSYEIFQSNGIKMYQSQSKKIKDVIEDLKNNKLNIIDKPVASHTGLGNQRRFRGGN